MSGTLRRRLVHAVLAALVTLAAPLQSSGAQGKSGGMAEMMPPLAPIPAGANYVAGDVRFMQGMIAHHAQALTMTAMAPTHGASPAILSLCKKINISQRDDIDMMQDWLRRRKQVVTDPNAAHQMFMPGMLTPAQMHTLGQARGTRFDSLFLTYMIQHHQGAISMVQDLFAANGGGAASEMYRFASDVRADQTVEIHRMQQMLTLDRRSRNP